MAAANLTGAQAWSPNNELRYRDKLPMGASQKWFPGCLVGWDTSSSATKGYAVKLDQTSPNASIIILGRYNPTIGGPVTADNSTGANGAFYAEVQFLKPRYLYWMDNVASGNACVAADVGSPVYGESDHEVGHTAGSLSQVGIMYALGTASDGADAVGRVLVDATKGL